MSSAEDDGERRSECGCAGWHCGACGKLCWACSEGGADDWPELCDACWAVVMRESRDGEEPDEATQMIRLMRRMEVRT